MSEERDQFIYDAASAGIGEGVAASMVLFAVVGALVGGGVIPGHVMAEAIDAALIGLEGHDPPLPPVCLDVARKRVQRLHKFVSSGKADPPALPSTVEA